MVYLYNGYGTHKRDYYPGGGHVVDYREILRHHTAMIGREYCFAHSHDKPGQRYASRVHFVYTTMRK